MTTKKALITGITGQDGSYLAELLLEKGYEVHGIRRRSSSFNTGRIEHIYKDPMLDDTKMLLHYGDLTDSLNLNAVIAQVQPDEIYNLAAQSHVAVSFETPEYTANSDGLGTLRILESLRANNLIDKTKFYQASTSELYGLAQEVPQRKSTPFYPRLPRCILRRRGARLGCADGWLFADRLPGLGAGRRRVGGLRRRPFGRRTDAGPRPTERASALAPSCLIPRFDGAILSLEWKEALWDKFVTGAPRPRTPLEQQYSDRKLRSRS